MRLCSHRSREWNPKGSMFMLAIPSVPTDRYCHSRRRLRTNPVETGAVDYDEIVARREPRLFRRKVASISEDQQIKDA